MPDLISNPVIDDIVVQAMLLNLCFLSGPGQSRHVPFTFTPAPIDANTQSTLAAVAPLLGRLTQKLADCDDLIQAVHQPLTVGDAFFAEMLAMHRQLHHSGDLPRVPLLLQRSDFLLDEHLGPRLVECNSIAAGMAPFGEQAHRLHAYIGQRWPGEFARLHTPLAGTLLTNPATANMAGAIGQAAWKIHQDVGPDTQEPGFLMVVQDNEDNVFDQRLLEQRLRASGVSTYRRTFRQLHGQLSTGPNQSLQLAGAGTIHVVYLRAGYQYSDYVATDLDSKQCCDAICATRMFIERHRVAVNATVAQQLATSKRMQLHLTQGGEPLLQELGFNRSESALSAGVFAPMRPVNADSAKQLQADAANWVLKNQGEGGGHCLFDRDIVRRLEAMNPDEYSAWVLMQRLRPAGRPDATLIVRDGRASRVERLVSEIGIFTAHLGDQPLLADTSRPGHIGYLVRSKPGEVTEGGVHSGYGALDSLFVLDHRP